MSLEKMKTALRSLSAADENCFSTAMKWAGLQRLSAAAAAVRRRDMDVYIELLVYSSFSTSCLKFHWEAAAVKSSYTSKISATFTRRFIELQEN
jgi:hypothetical protein